MFVRESDDYDDDEKRNSFEIECIICTRYQFVCVCVCVRPICDEKRVSARCKLARQRPSLFADQRMSDRCERALRMQSMRVRAGGQVHVLMLCFTHIFCAYTHTHTWRKWAQTRANVQIANNSAIIIPRHSCCCCCCCCNTHTHISALLLAHHEHKNASSLRARAYK